MLACEEDAISHPRGWQMGLQALLRLQGRFRAGTQGGLGRQMLSGPVHGGGQAGGSPQAWEVVGGRGAANE